LPCNLSQPVYLATEEISGFKETDEGFFLESFLISDKQNLNDWQVTAEANQKDGHTFVGKPDILFIKDGKKDHTTGPTLEDSLKIQEPFRKGTIKKVLGTELGTKLHSVSKIEDPEVQELIRRKEIRFVSPAVFPRSFEDVEIIRTGPHTHVHKLHRYIGLHRAFVDEPAYGGEATIGQTCEGDGSACMQKLEQYKAGIGDDNIAPLQQKKIVKISKCNVTGNTIIEYENTSDIDQKKTDTIMPSVEEENKQLKSKLAETEDKLKANIEETKKKDDETAKKAADDKKDLEAKQSADEKKDEEAKAAQKAEDEKKEKDMTARIATELSQKLPLIASYVAAKTQVSGLDAAGQKELTDKLMTASLEEVQGKWDDIKDFVGSIPMNEIKSESKIGYGISTDYTAATYSKIDTMSTSDLVKESGIDA
jgi:hypothetical protein